MKRVLVIEDDIHIRENLVWLLEASGYAVLAAPHGRLGLELAHTQGPDLILCDVMMPEMDGHEVLHALRDTSPIATTPFIFLTARTNREDVRTGMAFGADDYITKPFSARDVLDAIEACLEKKARLEQEHEALMRELRTNISRSLPHELRTPLVAVLGFSKMLLDEWEDMASAVARGMVQDIYDAGCRLERTVDNYGYFAQLELIASDAHACAQLRKAHTAHVDTRAPELVHHVAETYDRSGDVHVEIESSQAAISNEHLDKVLIELTDNAFKFSKPSSPIIVRLRPEGDVLVLEVKDQGRGMQPSDVHRTGAFLQFERLFYENQGSGLGLAITQRLAELYGGSLRIDSVPAKGTTVRFAMPRTTPEAKDPVSSG